MIAMDRFNISALALELSSHEVSSDKIKSDKDGQKVSVHCMQPTHHSGLNSARPCPHDA